MKYQCKNCGTSLGYDGLCWRCRAMKERQEVLAWTDEEIQEKLRHLAANADKLDDYRASEYATLCQLMEIRALHSFSGPPLKPEPSPWPTSTTTLPPMCAMG